MIRKALFDATGEYVPVSYFPTMEAVPAFMAHKDAKKLLATPALNPDELVYANGSAMWVDKLNTAAVTRKIQSLADRGQKVPAAFIVKGLGLFVAADKTLAGLIAEITETSLKIRMHAARFGGVLALSKREQNFINNWESEAFRKKLVGGGAVPEPDHGHPLQRYERRQRRQSLRSAAGSLGRPGHSRERRRPGAAFRAGGHARRSMARCAGGESDGLFPHGPRSGADHDRPGHRRQHHQSQLQVRPGRQQEQHRLQRHEVR